MTLELMNEMIRELLELGKPVPKYVVDMPVAWSSKLYIANQLDEEKDTQRIYTILHDIYQEKMFRYDKYMHGAYETYIEQKVKFFLKLALLSIRVGQPPTESIPYIEEALVMLDGAESVYPYISPKEVSLVKEEVYSLINK
ncbi:MAG: hypothetical protein ATN35_00660 [Epulopiscium sp. Nele67-Bin004]|nr:MAG: hypothetical protein ATN35_00660 [Epulopiscium sp. Nele67-Bin004]